MNTFCELEDIYGDINQAFEDLQNRKIKAIRALIYSAIKAEDESVTLKEVGKMITLNDMERLGTAINEALNVAMPEVEENMGEQKATPIKKAGIGSGSFIWEQIF